MLFVLLLYLWLSLFSIVEGHQGFFIKHASSGLCLQSAPNYRVKGNDFATNPEHRWGPIYVVHFNNTCLHADAQFRFFQPFSVSVLHNIRKEGTFLARDRERYQSRFHIYCVPPGSLSSESFIYNADFALKQTKAGALKLQIGYCPTPRAPGVTSSGAIIPQNGDTVYQNTNCDKEEQKFTFGKLKLLFIVFFLGKAWMK